MFPKPQPPGANMHNEFLKTAGHPSHGNDQFAASFGNMNLGNMGQGSDPLSIQVSHALQFIEMMFYCKTDIEYMQEDNPVSRKFFLGLVVPSQNR